MELQRKPSFTRLVSISRRNSKCGYVPRFIKKGMLIVIPVLLFVLIGYFAFYHLQRIRAENDPKVRARHEHVRRSRPKGGRVHPFFGRSQRDLQHEPPSVGRPGLSIKKDFSIQFRKYIPKNVFVNCGGTYPWSVELFLDTYPHAREFETVTFLPDKSYRPMYERFENHTLHTPILVSSKNESVSIDMKGFGSGAAATNIVSKIDIARWLLENTHEDDHVVVKMDSSNERDIATHIKEADALENIDKYYSANSTKADRRFVRKVFKDRGLKVYQWDESTRNYADFDALNPAVLPSAGGFVARKCEYSENAEKFALFLYAREVTPVALKCLKFLSSIETKMPVTVFLPLDFLKSYPQDMPNILDSFTVGMYFNVEDDKRNHVLLRNDAVGFQHQMDKFSNLLQYILVGQSVNNEAADLLVKKRHYTVFRNGRDVTGMIPKLLQEEDVDIRDTGREQSEFLMVDIGRKHADYLALYMVRRFMPWLLEVHECKTASN